MNQPTNEPTDKMKAVGIAGVVVTLIVTLFSVVGVQIPDNVANSAIVAVSALTTIVTFIAGYMRRERP